MRPLVLTLLQLALEAEHPGETLTFGRGQVFDLLQLPGKGRDCDRLRGALHLLAGMLIVVNMTLVAGPAASTGRASAARA